jgi:S-adenosylmethionine synthetase
MTKQTYQFTSESVSAGHPDKVADQISDAILDAYLAQDPNAKVACECLITTGLLLIAGEVTSTANVDHTAIAQKVLDRIGYNNDAVGFNHHTAEIRNVIHTQSPEIHNSVIDGGAGDQGIMFGHACNDTPALMPLAITLSHEIVRKLHELREQNVLPWLRPDAKSQVTVTYDENGPVSVDKVVVSTQHSENISQAELHAAVIHHALEPILREWIKIKQPEYLINPSGSFIIGGPHGDTGLTGRKIVVDTYGGSCPHGGGAFSGKDPSKVDRSAAYAARFIAKHLVASGVATKCNVQLSYAIGVSEPTSIHIESFGTHRCDLKLLERAIYDLFPVQPQAIIEAFGLKRPIYQPTASYGHFGNVDYPWEVLDPQKIKALQSITGVNISGR